MHTHSPKDCTGRALTKQKSPVYKVDVGAFKDSDGDTIGDFAGVKSELDYLVELELSISHHSSHLPRLLLRDLMF